MEKTLILAFFLGCILSSPLGPMGMICLRRTLTYGPSAGFLSALGISFAYGIWSFVAIHGLTAISNWIEHEKNILELIIGMFFLLYGINGIFNTPSTYYPTLQKKGKLAGFLSTFFVVFLNPSTFISFAVLFTLFGVNKKPYGIINSLKVSLSVLAGSILFWLAISHFMSKLRKKLNESGYLLISNISSCLITLFGLAILAHCIFDYFHGL